MPASVELTRKSHQATRNSLAIRLHHCPSNCEIASDTTIDETMPHTTMATMAATTKWLASGPHRATTPRKTTTAMATSKMNMAALNTALYSGGRRITKITIIAPINRAATAWPGARYTRLMANGISDSENANDSRRKMNRNTLSSAMTKPTASMGSSHMGDGMTATPASGLVSSRAPPTTASTTAIIVTLSSGCDVDAEMGASTAPISLVTLSLFVITVGSPCRNAIETDPNVYRLPTPGP